MNDAGPVRAGEELDSDEVDRWMRQRVPDLQGLPRITQYRGGASNWTYRIAYANRDFVLRRPPAGTKAKSAHDMSREYAIQKALAPHFPYVPRLIDLADETSPLGVPFYVMERVEGVILRRDLPAALVMDEKAASRTSTNMIDKLIELHRVDYRAAGLERFAKGPGYPRRQIEGWSERYDKAKTWNVPTFRYVRDWLRANTPEDSATSVIHNDWRFDNVVLATDDLSRVIAVLDWEMATIGDPLMDLGNALAYWVEAGDDFVTRRLRRQPTHLPGMLTRRQIIERYAERTARPIENWPFYEVYGLFRLAVIAQQIYYRYHRGETKNPAFKSFWIFAHYLEWRCRRIVKRASRRTLVSQSTFKR